MGILNKLKCEYEIRLQLQPIRRKGGPCSPSSCRLPLGAVGEYRGRAVSNELRLVLTSHMASISEYLQCMACIFIYLSYGDCSH